MNESCEVFQLRSTRRLHSAGKHCFSAIDFHTPWHQITSRKQSPFSFNLLPWYFYGVSYGCVSKSLNWVNCERSPGSSCTISFTRKTQSAPIWVCLPGFLVQKSPDVHLLIMSKAFWDVLGGNQKLKHTLFIAFHHNSFYTSCLEICRESTTTFSTWPGWFQPRCSTPSTSPKRSKTTDTSVDLGECHGHSFAHFEWLDSENSYKPPINKKTLPFWMLSCVIANEKNKQKSRANEKNT